MNKKVWDSHLFIFSPKCAEIALFAFSNYNNQLSRRSKEEEVMDLILLANKKLHLSIKKINYQ